MSAGNDDWLEDVRRWYFNGGAPAARTAGGNPSVKSGLAKASNPVDLGYEAAQPAIQSRNWPSTSSGELRDFR